MAYTAGQLRTEIRRLLNESSASFFTDADIDAWIVDAVLDISVKARCVEGETTFAINSGNRSYAQPTGLIGIEAVLLGGSSLVRTRLRQFGQIHSATAGPPTAYAHFIGKLWFSPIPDTTYEATVLYWKRTSTYTDLPEEYQLLALLFGVMRGKLKDERYAEAGQLYTMYIQELNFQRLDLEEPEPDSREMLRIPDQVRAANA
jgi:hypothetical protein